MVTPDLVLSSMDPSQQSWTPAAAWTPTQQQHGDVLQPSISMANPVSTMAMDAKPSCSMAMDPTQQQHAHGHGPQHGHGRGQDPSTGMGIGMNDPSGMTMAPGAWTSVNVDSHKCTRILITLISFHKSSRVCKSFWNCKSSHSAVPMLRLRVLHDPECLRQRQPTEQQPK